MQIIAVYNIKGGVGKTATAVNLAYRASRQAPTLIWDLDPQGASSFYFRIRPRVKGGARKLVAGGRRHLDRLIKGTDFEGLDLLPADFSYRHMDLELDEVKRPARQLLRLLRPLAAEYEYLFLDCPPSISLVSENVFAAADLLLVPLIPTTLSVRTLVQLLHYFRKQRRRHPRVMPFFSMVDRRKNMHREVMHELPRKLKGIARVYVPYASEVERMGIHRSPVAEFAPQGVAAKAYEALWQEVQRRL